jgi:predicted neutral ceramidase superfamily lipid hydrolase
MNWKRKTYGSLLGLIGFLLSPLSWWNDLFVNVPLAIAFAWLVSLVYKPAFVAAAVVGYWLTNVLGFFLMHKGAEKTLSNEDKPYSRRSLIRDLIISLLYTLLIVLLVQFGVLKPVTDYFQRH